MTAAAWGGAAAGLGRAEKGGRRRRKEKGMKRKAANRERCPVAAYARVKGWAWGGGGSPLVALHTTSALQCVVL